MKIAMQVALSICFATGCLADEPTQQGSSNGDGESAHAAAELPGADPSGYVLAPTIVSPEGFTEQSALAPAVPAPVADDSSADVPPVTMHPLTTYNLPKSGTSHPQDDGAVVDFAYEFHGASGHSKVCVKAYGDIGGVHTTKTIVYFNLYRDASVGWNNDGRTRYYFALDGAVHVARWSPSHLSENNYAVGWERIRYSINDGQVTIHYTEYYQ